MSTAPTERDVVVTGVVTPGPAPPPDIRGFCDLPASMTATIATGGKKKGKPIEASIHLAVHQKNDKVGQLTGRAMYVINPVFEEKGRSRSS